MIKLTIDTYFREGRDYGLEEIYADMPDEVAIGLHRIRNADVWEQLLDSARSSVSPEEGDDVVHALFMSDKDTLAKYITIDVAGVVPKGFLSYEEDPAQTTERFETPFLFDVDKFWEDAQIEH